MFGVWFCPSGFGLLVASFGDMGGAFVWSAGFSVLCCWAVSVCACCWEGRRVRFVCGGVVGVGLWGWVVVGGGWAGVFAAWPWPMVGVLDGRGVSVVVCIRGVAGGVVLGDGVWGLPALWGRNRCSALPAFSRGGGVDI